MGRGLFTQANATGCAMRLDIRAVPDGEAGTRETLRVMAGWAARDARVPLVRETALRASRGLSGVLGVEAVREWVAAHTRFVPDPVSMEWVQSPEAQARLVARDGLVAGDCDDAATFAAGLGRALGWGARLVAVGFLDNPNPYSHVWCELQAVSPTGTGGTWVECDVTRPFQDVPVERIARVLVYPVP